MRRNKGKTKRENDQERIWLKCGFKFNLSLHLAELLNDKITHFNLARVRFPICKMGDNLSTAYRSKRYKHAKPTKHTCVHTSRHREPHTMPLKYAQHRCSGGYWTHHWLLGVGYWYKDALPHLLEGKAWKLPLGYSYGWQLGHDYIGQ